MEKLKEYSINKKFLLEKITNWDILFTITEKILKRNSDDYILEIISLWYPFFYDLDGKCQEMIEYDVTYIFSNKFPEIEESDCLET